MKKYVSFFRIRFLTGLQYRAAAWAGLSTQFVWGTMLLLMFRAFYRADTSAFPMTFEQLSSYIWLQQALLALLITWSFDEDLFESIRSGSVAYELCRPADLFGMWMCRTVATRLSRTALRCLPVLIVAAVLPRPWGISPPASPLALLAFLVSVLLGLLVISAMGMLVYALTFYTISPVGLRTIFASAAEFLSGGFIPLPFLPDSIRRVVDMLPFASVQNTPLLIYGGFLSGQEALFRIALQAAWALALILAGRLILLRAIRHVVLQGG